MATEPKAQLWAKARERWPRRTAKAERVNAALVSYVEWLEENFNPKLVMLFGSYADGTFRMNSDVDVLVVAEKMPHRRTDRVKVLQREFEFPAKLQAFIYTPNQFITMCKKDNSVAFSALTEGQILHIDPNYRQELITVLQATSPTTG